jgi:UDP-N-acetylmuramoyl-L-alanyl-D-glutamate--2,6-diaminopimelate ligase
MLHRLKQLAPEPVKQAWHYALARAAAVVYRHPSERLIVFGVTGTNGKSSTVQFMGQMLEAMGEKVGYTTTAGFRVAGHDIENKMKMTMPGRMYLQQLLKRMVREGCRYAIVETSSQGVAQYRHLGVNYDLVVFTNLTPEHIEAHGGFENYKAAKGALFAHLAAGRRKQLGGRMIPKTSVVNADSEHADYFAGFPVDEVVRFSLEGKGDVNVEVEKWGAEGAVVKLHDDASGEAKFTIPLMGEFQVQNVVGAVTALLAAGFELGRVAKAVAELQPVPGRLERIALGQPFEVIVDYAYEPAALEALFKAVAPLKSKRLIGVHGSAGGGRDLARRPLIGALAAAHESIVIVTNEDPYDENPLEIIEQVAEGARQAGKVEDKDLFLIESRKEAIRKAIDLAKPGDTVLITGKGSEPVMAVAGGKKIPWDDRKEARAAIKARFL